MKAEEHKAEGYPFDGEFYLWDYRYYDRKFIEASLALDDALVKEYFPVSVVVPTILEIYQNLLGVRFEKLDGETWHPEVQMFAVWEDGAKDESGFVGYCYLDLFPRGTSLRSILLCLSLNLSLVCDRYRFSFLMTSRWHEDSVQVLARGSVGPHSWFHNTGRQAFVSAHGHGCKPCEANTRPPCADAARRRRDVLPRNGTCLPRVAQQHAVFPVPWHKVGVLRHSAV